MNLQIHHPSSFRSPTQIFVFVLLIVFVGEACVMFILPSVAPPTISDLALAIVDSAMLTVITAPLLWRVIIRPLRRVAVAERMKAASIIHAASDGIITTDEYALIESVNPAIERIFGYAAIDLIGKHLRMLVSSRHNNPNPDTVLHLLQTSASMDSGSNHELEGQRMDGSVFPMLLSISEIYFSNKRVFTTIVRDLTDQKRTQLRQREHDMVRAEQMTIVAQLATGVAHELRNPLTAIKLLVQNNQEELTSRKVPIEDLNIIEKEINRMERSLKTFLGFAKPAKSIRQLFDLSDLIDQVFLLVEGRAFQQHVVCVKFAPSQEQSSINADRDKIQQLVLNLVLNALDAMPDGGTLEINIAPDPSGFMEIQVTDSGSGVPAKVLQHLFEPFVTTKETGIGMGLLICKRISDEHNGSLSTTNRPEGGACFTLRLPT